MFPTREIARAVSAGIVTIETHTATAAPIRIMGTASPAGDTILKGHGPMAAGASLQEPGADGEHLVVSFFDDIILQVVGRPSGDILTAFAGGAMHLVRKYAA